MEVRRVHAQKEKEDIQRFWPPELREGEPSWKGNHMGSRPISGSKKRGRQDSIGPR